MQIRKTLAGLLIATALGISISNVQSSEEIESQLNPGRVTESVRRPMAPRRNSMKLEVPQIKTPDLEVKLNENSNPPISSQKVYETPRYLSSFISHMEGDLECDDNFYANVKVSLEEFLQLQESIIRLSDDLGVTKEESLKYDFSRMELNFKGDIKYIFAQASDTSMVSIRTPSFRYDVDFNIPKQEDNPYKIRESSSISIKSINLARLNENLGREGAKFGLSYTLKDLDSKGNSPYGETSDIVIKKGADKPLKNLIRPELRRTNPNIDFSEGYIRSLPERLKRIRDLYNNKFNQ